MVPGTYNIITRIPRSVIFICPWHQTRHFSALRSLRSVLGSLQKMILWHQKEQEYCCVSYRVHTILSKEGVYDTFWYLTQDNSNTKMHCQRDNSLPDEDLQAGRPRLSRWAGRHLFIYSTAVRQVRLYCILPVQRYHSISHSGRKISRCIDFATRTETVDFWECSYSEQ